jgi:hypothetical protein
MRTPYVSPPEQAAVTGIAQRNCELSGQPQSVASCPVGVFFMYDARRQPPAAKYVLRFTVQNAQIGNAGRRQALVHGGPPQDRARCEGIPILTPKSVYPQELPSLCPGGRPPKLRPLWPFRRSPFHDPHPQAPGARGKRCGSERTPPSRAHQRGWGTLPEGAQAAVASRQATGQAKACQAASGQVKGRLTRDSGKWVVRRSWRAPLDLTASP